MTTTIIMMIVHVMAFARPLVTSRTAWYTAINETNWIDKSNREKFIVVFPQSLGKYDRWGGRTGWDFERTHDVLYVKVL